jgi:DNA-binding FadR family transcriptional regulator
VERRTASTVFAPLRHAPAYRVLSDRIERRILDGHLKPGDPLPTEQALAETFGVNRSTVREAIRLLEQEGLLVRAAGRRLRIAQPGMGDLAPRAMRAMVLEAVSFRELWEVGVTLEPRAARLAAGHATESDLAALDENLARTEAVLARGESYINLDVQFHALVARASGNRVLMLAREPVSLLLAPSFERLRRTLPQAGARNLEAHRRIVEAIRRRDPDEAEAWTHRHFVDFQRGYRVARLDVEAPVDWPEQGFTSHPAATTETEETP